jgi:hypothetical protein
MFVSIFFLNYFKFIKFNYFFLILFVIWYLFDVLFFAGLFPLIKEVTLHIKSVTLIKNLY